MSTLSYKAEHPFDIRSSEAQRVCAKYSDRVPVICERAASASVPSIDKKKYLVPSDLTVGQFVYVIRKRIKLTPEQALFVFVEGSVLPPTAAVMSNIYEEYKDEDGFLYMTYSGENTFGDWEQYAVDC